MIAAPSGCQRAHTADLRRGLELRRAGVGSGRKRGFPAAPALILRVRPIRVSVGMHAHGRFQRVEELLMQLACARRSAGKQVLAGLLGVLDLWRVSDLDDPPVHVHDQLARGRRAWSAHLAREIEARHAVAAHARRIRVQRLCDRQARAGRRRGRVRPTATTGRQHSDPAHGGGDGRPQQASRRRLPVVSRFIWASISLGRNWDAAPCCCPRVRWPRGLCVSCVRGGGAGRVRAGSHGTRMQITLGFSGGVVGWRVGEGVW
jgi:hypothetical protein